MEHQKIIDTFEMYHEAITTMLVDYSFEGKMP
jgi:hypothetical protein